MDDEREPTSTLLLPDEGGTRGGVIDTPSMPSGRTQGR
jgi:hypothetical protein